MNSENEKILDIFRETGALMEGHFILRSGLHSGHFFQCARVCEHLDRVTELVEMLVKKLGDIECDTVIAPALGGLVLGQEVARQLKKRFIFAEKENGALVLRRNFKISEGSFGLFEPAKIDSLSIPETDRVLLWDAWKKYSENGFAVMRAECADGVKAVFEQTDIYNKQ